MTPRGHKPCAPSIPCSFFRCASIRVQVSIIFPLWIVRCLPVFSLHSVQILSRILFCGFSTPTKELYHSLLDAFASQTQVTFDFSFPRWRVAIFKAPSFIEVRTKKKRMPLCWSPFLALFKTCRRMSLVVTTAWASSSLDKMSENLSTPRAETAVNYGAISLLGSEDVSNEVVCKEQAQSPPNEAFKPPNKAIKPPVKAIKPSNAVSGPPNESSFSAVPDALVNAGSNENSEITSACYEPDAFSTSCKPSKDFSAFLDKIFRRKLSYDQVLDIWEASRVPAVDALAYPSLDPNIINQIFKPRNICKSVKKNQHLFSMLSLLPLALYVACMMHLNQTILFLLRISKVNVRAGVISGPSLWVLFAPRGFFPGTPVFPLLKTHLKFNLFWFELIYSLPNW